MFRNATVHQLRLTVAAAPVRIAADADLSPSAGAGAGAAREGGLEEFDQLDFVVKPLGAWPGRRRH